MNLFSRLIETNDIVLIAAVTDALDLGKRAEIEAEIRRSILAQPGVSVRWIDLVAPKWIIKSTAGKPARATTRDKFLAAHPELNVKL